MKISHIACLLALTALAGCKNAEDTENALRIPGGKPPTVQASAEGPNHRPPGSIKLPGANDPPAPAATEGPDHRPPAPLRIPGGNAAPTAETPRPAPIRVPGRK